MKKDILTKAEFLVYTFVMSFGIFFCLIFGIAGCIAFVTWTSLPFEALFFLLRASIACAFVTTILFPLSREGREAFDELQSKRNG